MPASGDGSANCVSRNPLATGRMRGGFGRKLWGKLRQEGPQRLLLEFEFGQAWLMQLATLLSTAQVFITILGTTQAHFSHRLRGLEAQRLRAWRDWPVFNHGDAAPGSMGAARGKRIH